MPDKTDTRRAGGYRTIRGCTRYPNLKHAQRAPWLKALRKHLSLKLAQHDEATERLVRGSEFQFNSLRASGPNRSGCGKIGNPATRAATLCALILKQGRKPILPSHKGPAKARYNAFDLLAAGLAVMVQCKHDGDIAMPSMDHRPYFISVQVGRALHHYLHSESRTYVKDDGRGNVGEETVKYTRLQLQSRNVCQQLEKLLNECGADGWMREEGRAIASLVSKATARRLLRLNAKANRTYSKTVQSSTA